MKLGVFARGIDAVAIHFQTDMSKHMHSLNLIVAGVDPRAQASDRIRPGCTRSPAATCNSAASSRARLSGTRVADKNAPSCSSWALVTGIGPYKTVGVLTGPTYKIREDPDLIFIDGVPQIQWHNEDIVLAKKIWVLK